RCDAVRDALSGAVRRLGDRQRSGAPRQGGPDAPRRDRLRRHLTTGHRQGRMGRMERVAEITRRDIVCAGGMPGHLALPQASGKVPGVVILHERYGFVQHPRDVADRFAELGMAGLAVNGFHRCDYQDALAAGTKRYRFADPETVDIVSAAIEALAATGRVD